MTNTGDIFGAIVAQLYISLPQTNVLTGIPVRILRGFVNISLQPGESSTVALQLRRRDLSHWDVVMQDWVIPSGEIGVSVRFSSRDLPMNGSVVLVFYLKSNRGHKRYRMIHRLPYNLPRGKPRNLIHEF